MRSGDQTQDVMHQGRTLADCATLAPLYLTLNYQNYKKHQESNLSRNIDFLLTFIEYHCIIHNSHISTLYLQHSVVPSILLPCLSTHQHFLFPCLSKTVHCSGRKYPSWSHDGKWIPGTGCPSPLTNSKGRFCRSLFRQGGTETENRFFIYVALFTYCSVSDKAQLQKKKPAASWTFIKTRYG